MRTILDDRRSHASVIAPLPFTFVLGVTLLVAPIAKANVFDDPFGTESTAIVRAQGGNTTYSSNDSGPISSHAMQAATGTTLDVPEEWWASADFHSDLGVGRAHVYSAVSEEDWLSAWGDAYWWDTLTITMEGHEGETGTADVGISISGLVNTISGNSPEHGMVTGFIAMTKWKYNGSWTWDQPFMNEDFTYSGNMSIHETVSRSFSFVYGEPFKLDARFYLEAYVQDGSNPVTGQATGDFSSSAVFSELTLPTGALVESASGASYPIPEPSTALLLVTGLVGLALRRRPSA